VAIDLCERKQPSAARGTQMNSDPAKGGPVLVGSGFILRALGVRQGLGDTDRGKQLKEVDINPTNTNSDTGIRWSYRVPEDEKRRNSNGHSLNARLSCQRTVGRRQPSTGGKRRRQARNNSTSAAIEANNQFGL